MWSVSCFAQQQGLPKMDGLLQASMNAYFQRPSSPASDLRVVSQGSSQGGSAPALGESQGGSAPSQGQDPALPVADAAAAFLGLLVVLHD